jgi:hypothetical protein
MERLMREVIEVLTFAPWTFYLTDSPRHLVAPLSDTPYCSKFIVDVREDQRQVLVHTMARMCVAEEKRLDVGMFIHHVNAQCAIGSFDFDIREGWLAYRMGIDMRTTALTPDVMATVLAEGVIANKAYIPIVEDIVSGCATLAEAAYQIDGLACDPKLLTDTARVDCGYLSDLRGTGAGRDETRHALDRADLGLRTDSVKRNDRRND